jgi:cbb3-type cytochrome oxidase subunit 1
MQVLTVHGEIHTPEVVNAEFHATGSLAVIAHRLEMEGAKILSRNSSHFRFRGGLGAKFIASKWSFLLSISSGEINVFAKDNRVFASYKIRFDEWVLIVLVEFIVIGLIMMYSFAQDSTNNAFISNLYCLATLFILSLCYFGASSALAAGRFQELLRSCLIESNQAMPDYTQ